MSLFFYTDWVCDDFLNASFEQGKSFSRLLIWTAIKENKKRNIPLFNAGEDISPNDSLAQFKKRFGTKKVEVFVLKKIHDIALFATLCNAANKRIDTLFFPPYHQNN